MTNAAEVMHPGVTCIGQHDTLVTAAQRMRQLGVGAHCRSAVTTTGRLHGMLNDRDVVVKCIADKSDPFTMTAGELAQETIHRVGSSASFQQMLDIMEQYQVRRLPVIDDNHRVVGIVSEADIARHLPEHSIAQFVKAICAQRAVAGG